MPEVLAYKQRPVQVTARTLSLVERGEHLTLLCRICKGEVALNDLYYTDPLTGLRRLSYACPACRAKTKGTLPDSLRRFTRSSLVQPAARKQRDMELALAEVLYVYDLPSLDALLVPYAPPSSPQAAALKVLYAVYSDLGLSASQIGDTLLRDHTTVVRGLKRMKTGQYAPDVLARDVYRTIMKKTLALNPSF